MRASRFAHFTVTCSLIFTFYSCAPLPLVKSIRPIEERAFSERVRYKEIQELYSRSFYAEVVSKIKSFENQFPESALLAQVKNIEGLALLLTRQTLQAILAFKGALQKNDNEILKQFILYNLASAQFDVHQFKDAELTLFEIKPSALNPETQRKYKALQTVLAQKILESNLAVTEEIQKQKIPTPEADPSRVGVLLPLKGKYASFGNRCLQGIELAFKIFNPDEPNSKITLVIEDSGETTEQALLALNKLIFQHHVIAILGPLLSKGIDQVTQKAQELRIPILPLSQQPGGTGDFVFPIALTPKLQAEGIARFAIQKLGLHRFAILYPKDYFGEQFSQYFWDTVEQLGGEITGVESYLPEETDFRQAVDKLSGLYYTQARKAELEALAEERKLNNIKKRTRKTEQYFTLKPIVNFEAVFIPDEPKTIGQILPTFAYRDVEKIKFLGTATWNSPELAKRTQNYAEGAAFIDIFNPESEALATKNFITRYQNTFALTPASVEATAFDAASLIDHALNVTSNTTPTLVRDHLRTLSEYPGVSGAISFKNENLTRELFVFTIKNGKIVLTE